MTEQEISEMMKDLKNKRDMRTSSPVVAVNSSVEKEQEIAAEVSEKIGEEVITGHSVVSSSIPEDAEWPDAPTEIEGQVESETDIEVVSNESDSEVENVENSDNEVVDESAENDEDSVDRGTVENIIDYCEKYLLDIFDEVRDEVHDTALVHLMKLQISEDDADEDTLVEAYGYAAKIVLNRYMEGLNPDDREDSAAIIALSEVLKYAK